MGKYSNFREVDKKNQFFWYNVVYKFYNNNWMFGIVIFNNLLYTSLLVCIKYCTHLKFQSMLRPRFSFIANTVCICKDGTAAATCIA